MFVQGVDHMKTMLHEREKKPKSGSSARNGRNPCTGNIYLHTRNGRILPYSSNTCTQISDISENKLKVGFYLDKNLVREFKQFVATKYGKTERGLLSFEVEQAIRTWIALHTKAQTEVHAPNPTPRVLIVWNQVKDYISRYFYYGEPIKSGQHLPKQIIEQAIAAVRGSDPRTVRKWFQTFGRFHLIKPLRGNVWEVM